MEIMRMENAREIIDFRTEILLEKFLAKIDAKNNETVSYNQAEIFLRMLPYTPGAGKKTEECTRRLLARLAE